MKFNFPGHKYLGPGNPVNNGEPVDEDDRIAQRHDIAYDRARNSKDIRTADKTAIGEFTSDFLRTGNSHSAIGAVGLGAKFIGESIVGVQYPSMPGPSSTPKPNTRGRVQGQVEFFENLNESSISNLSASTAGSMDPNLAESANTEDGPSRSARAGSGPGAGSIGAGGSASIVPIYRGIFQPTNRFNLSYRKEYRYFMQTSKSGYYCGNATLANGDEYVHLRLGSVHDIPWDRLAMYVSPREAAMMRTQFTKVTVDGVNVQVHSMGVRLPFETNAGVTTVANANVQMPLVEMFNIDQYYYTNTDGTKINAMFDQLQGTSIYPAEPATTVASDADPSTTFTNITAMFETREFDNPLEILLPRPARRTNADSFANALREYHNEPQFTMAITNSANGSNHLGKLFEREYKPKNGVIFQHCTNQTYTEMVNENGDEYNVQLPHLSRNINGPLLDTDEDFILWWNSEYRKVRVENDLNINVTDPKGVGRMPRFPIGMYNLRNAKSPNQDIVSAQWEFILVCEMNVTCEVGVKGVYNRNILAPETQHIYPAVRPGSSKRKVEFTDHNGRKQFNRPTLTEVSVIPPQWIDNTTEAVDYDPSSRAAEIAANKIRKRQSDPGTSETVSKRITPTRVDAPTRVDLPIPPAPESSDPMHVYMDNAYPVGMLAPDARKQFLSYLDTNPKNVKTIDDYFKQLLKH